MLVTGYAFKPNSEASVAVGGAKFAMYTQNDGAWVKNAAEEAKLIDTMRKGADVVIKATTSRGTQTTDTFSLKGISPGARPGVAGVQVGCALRASLPHLC